MRSFVPFARHRPWKLTMPVYDGRECPDCGACVLGSRARKHHQAWHNQRTDYDSQILAAVKQLARRAGLNVVEAAHEDAPDGLYDDYDDQLTGKANAAMNGGSYVRLDHDDTDTDDEVDDDE